MLALAGGFLASSCTVQEDSGEGVTALRAPSGQHVRDWPLRYLRGRRARLTRQRIVRLRLAMIGRGSPPVTFGVNPATSVVAIT